MKFVNVGKRYGNNEVLKGFSYEFTPEKYCIVGENGGGKTTLLMLAAGLEKPDAGDISFCGQAVDAPNVKPRIGISTDKIVFPRFLTAKQLIEFHCSCYKVSWPGQLIEDLHFNDHISTLVPDLSLGNQKKLSLVLALTHDADCLLLDEPSTGLDAYSRAFVLQYLDSFKGTLIVTSHDPVFTENPGYQILALPHKS